MRIWEQTLLGLALAWGLALPVLAGLVPMYSEDSVAVSGGSSVGTQSSATLYQVNGWGALIPLVVPLGVAVIVTLLLAIRRSDSGPGVIAWGVVGLLAAGTVLAMMTIGIFVLPVTGSLIAACAIRQAGAVPVLPPAVPVL
jgi:hypothetical protein